MNLMEITKGYEPKQNEQTEQTKNLPDITDRWKQLAMEQAASLEKVTAERDELQVKYQKMSEFIQEFQERTHKLKMEKQARQAEYQAEREKKRADVEIRRARRKAKSEVEDMKERQFFWDWGYLTIIFFCILQNGAFQRDVLKLIMIPINWCKEYIAWFEQLEYTSNTVGEMLFKGFFSMFIIAIGTLGGVFFVWAEIEQYKKIWDDLYKMVLISSISFVAVLGNLIREYLPLNLILVILFINIGTILLRAYLKKKYPQMYD